MSVVQMQKHDGEPRPDKSTCYSRSIPRLMNVNRAIEHLAKTQTDRRKPDMTAGQNTNHTTATKPRNAVGMFDSFETLQQAINDLRESGWNRYGIRPLTCRSNPHQWQPARGANTRHEEGRTGSENPQRPSRSRCAWAHLKRTTARHRSQSHGQTG